MRMWFRHHQYVRGTNTQEELASIIGRTNDLAQSIRRDIEAKCLRNSARETCRYVGSDNFPEAILGTLVLLAAGADLIGNTRHTWSTAVPGEQNLSVHRSFRRKTDYRSQVLSGTSHRGGQILLARGRLLL